MGKPVPDEPILFMKPPSALLPPGGAIVRPRLRARRLRRRGSPWSSVSACTAPPEVVAAHIFGYTALNDVTVRDLQKRTASSPAPRGFDSFCPVGPAIATDLDPEHFRVRTRKNGVCRSRDTQGDELVFSVLRLVSFISYVMTLEPGDVISTGTPAGVSNLNPATSSKSSSMASASCATPSSLASHVPRHESAPLVCDGPASRIGCAGWRARLALSSLPAAPRRLSLEPVGLSRHELTLVSPWQEAQRVSAPDRRRR